MGQNNTERISHNLEGLPTTFRDDQLYQIINDLGEEDSGKGYSQVLRTGPFVTSIIVWLDSGMTKKRTDAVISRTGAFVTSIVKRIYDEDGVAVVSTITATVTRAGDNTISFVNVGITRP